MELKMESSLNIIRKKLHRKSILLLTNQARRQMNAPDFLNPGVKLQFPFLSSTLFHYYVAAEAQHS
jgi:hypothetical protein